MAVEREIKLRVAGADQARATLAQAQAAVEQAIANHAQGKTNLELARVTAERWASLFAQGVVSRQENDQYQAQFQAQSANVQALEKAIAAQRSNVGAAEANLARLNEVQGYRVVRAPFDGVVVRRHVDPGATLGPGQPLLDIRSEGAGELTTPVPEYRNPGKNWRLKRGAMPHWYKAQQGIRTRALSGAARVARFRPRV